jgi:hypothetical protein
MPARRFPSPWTAEVTPNCFIVRDANGQALGLTSDAAIIAARFPQSGDVKSANLGTTWSASHSGPRKINSL